MSKVGQFTVEFGNQNSGMVLVTATYHQEVGVAPVKKAEKGYFKLPFSPQDFLDWGTHQGITINRRFYDADRSLPKEQEPENVGSELFSSVFNGKILALFSEAMNEIETDNYLRIVFVFDEENIHHTEIYSLPWEIVYHSSYLCLHPKITISRHILKTNISTPDSFDKPINVLAVISEPNDASLIRFDSQKHKNVFNKFANQKLIEVHFAATVDELTNKLDTNPDIIHLMGHSVYKSSFWGFYFNDSNGYADFKVGPKIFEAISKKQPKNLKLVHIVSCDSARVDGESDQQNMALPFGGLAERMTKLGCPVIGMQFPIFPEDVISYADIFLSKLIAGLTIDLALDEARNQMRHSNNSALTWITPVLLTGISPGLNQKLNVTPLDIPLSGNTQTEWFNHGKKMSNTFNQSFSINGNRIILPILPIISAPHYDLNGNNVLINISSKTNPNTPPISKNFNDNGKFIQIKLIYQSDDVKPKNYQAYDDIQQLLSTFLTFENPGVVHLVLDTYPELSFLLGACLSREPFNKYTIFTFES